MSATIYDRRQGDRRDQAGQASVSRYYGGIEHRDPYLNGKGRRVFRHGAVIRTEDMLSDVQKWLSANAKGDFKVSAEPVSNESGKFDIKIGCQAEQDLRKLVAKLQA